MLRRGCTLFNTRITSTLNFPLFPCSLLPPGLRADREPGLSKIVPKSDSPSNMLARVVLSPSRPNA